MGRFDLGGQTVLVTGASSGIGREIALELARRGARLAVAARREERLDELVRVLDRAGGEPVALPVDLAEPGAPADLARRATEALGRVDVLVNNAGLGLGANQLAVGDADAAREVFQVNFWAPLALQRALVPPMVQRGQGAVVNVTSLVTVSPWPGLGTYSSTKAALASATETLRLELVNSGVHVLEVIPGPVETAIQAESRLLPGFTAATRGMPTGDPAELARLVARGLERRRARVVYPRALSASYVLPGLMRVVLPRVVSRFIPRDAVPDQRVLRAGSRGDDEALRARSEWEATREAQRA